MNFAFAVFDVNAIPADMNMPVIAIDIDASCVYTQALAAAFRRVFFRNISFVVAVCCIVVFSIFIWRAVNKLVKCDVVNFCEIDKIVGIRRGLGAFPFGNRLAAYTELGSKLFLRQTAFFLYS